MLTGIPVLNLLFGGNLLTPKSSTCWHMSSPIVLSLVPLKLSCSNFIFLTTALNYKTIYLKFYVSYTFNRVIIK